MECKVVVSDPEDGKSYSIELKDDQAKRLSGLEIEAEFDGGLVGLAGYKLKVTGGSDRCGFPMKEGVHGTSRPKVLASGGVGYNPTESVRKRKRVRGERIAEDITQVNTVIVERGPKPVSELVGSSKDGGEEGEAPAEGGEAKAEAAPAGEPGVKPEGGEAKKEEAKAEDSKPEEPKAEEKKGESKPEEKPPEEPKTEEPKSEGEQAAEEAKPPGDQAQ